MKRIMSALRGSARSLIVAGMLFALASTGFAQGADPSTVKPAWQIEKELADKPPVPVKSFGAFFIGYEFPQYSGTLASHLDEWKSLINISLGVETSMMEKSSMLSGVEGDLALTFNNDGSRMLMNSMAMIGYSINLKPLRFNLGARLGLSIIDVMDDRSGGVDYTGLGYIIGPESSLYISLGSKTWLWARARYAYAQYATLDSSANPLNLGDNQLSTLSIQAGLAFDL